jgi:hypothetical protein
VPQTKVESQFGDHETIKLMRELYQILEAAIGVTEKTCLHINAITGGIQISKSANPDILIAILLDASALRQ